jgi:hypothetical protein
MMEPAEFFPVAKTGQHVPYYDRILHMSIVRRFPVALWHFWSAKTQAVFVERLSVHLPSLSCSSLYGATNTQVSLTLG